MGADKGVEILFFPCHVEADRLEIIGKANRSA